MFTGTGIHFGIGRSPSTVFGKASLFALLAAAFTGSAAAQDGVILRDMQPATVAALQTGQQLLIKNRNEPLDFAGRSIQTSGFTGVVGYSSETAYVAVIAGSVSVDGLDVRPGRILLLPPFNAEPIVERFDAARFAASWPQPAREAEEASLAALNALAQGQRRAIAFGRLGRTSLNVAAPGGAEREMAARTVKGSDAIREIRFAPVSSAEQVEQSIAENFLAALAAGDAAAVAAFLDPVPYGNTDLRNGASEARQASAEQLLGRRDWKSLLSTATVTRGSEANEWVIDARNATGVLRLRPMGDFAFVRTIEMGAR